MTAVNLRSLSAAFLALFLLSLTAMGAPEPAPQTGGNAGSIGGTVEDQSGSVITGATVSIKNPVSGYDRSATTDTQGRFSFTNIPFNL